MDATRIVKARIGSTYISLILGRVNRLIRHVCIGPVLATARTRHPLDNPASTQRTSGLRSYAAIDSSDKAASVQLYRTLELGTHHTGPQLLITSERSDAVFIGQLRIDLVLANARIRHSSDKSRSVQCTSLAPSDAQIDTTASPNRSSAIGRSDEGRIRQVSIGLPLPNA